MISTKILLGLMTFLALVATFGWLLPSLLSAPSTLSVMGAVGIIIFLIWLAAFVIETVIGRNKNKKP